MDEINHQIGLHLILILCTSFYITFTFHGQRKVNVALSALNPKNGTLHAVMFVHKSGVSPWKDSKYVRIVARLTSQMLPIPPMVIADSAKQTQKVIL